MLAHNQSTPLNIAQLGASLDVAATTAKRYLELLEDLLLVRSLRPWSNNVGKRLVKAPKIYVRDSGIVHALLGIATTNDLLAHPVAGASWEGFVVENLIGAMPVGATAWYYRTAAGAEIDLVIEYGTHQRMAIEIKRSMAPTVSKGFYTGCDDIAATHRYVVYPGSEVYTGPHDSTITPVHHLMQTLQQMA
jgi:hypothetical protein